MVNSDVNDGAKQNRKSYELYIPVEAKEKNEDGTLRHQEHKIMKNASVVGILLYTAEAYSVRMHVVVNRRSEQ